MAPMTDYQITEAMQVYGGSFAKCLGQLCRLADPENLARLKAAFPETWAEYAGLAEMRARRLTEQAR